MSRITIILFAGLVIFVAADVFVLPNCPGENEEMKCGSFCHKTCQTLDKPCHVQARACGCFCKDGYVRTKFPRGACIEIDECDEVKRVDK